MTETIDIQDVPFAEDDCAVQEACVDAPGLRRLLRFATTTPNTGTADVYFGDVSDEVGFEYSECHEHSHFSAYAEFVLLSADGTTAVTGRKQAFCMMDNENWGDEGAARYTCDFQGVSVGWADTYASYLDCQWIDITDLSAGDYTLRVTVNPDQVIAERSYADNVSEVTVTVPERADQPPVTDACGTLSYGEHRDCGWDVAGTFACVPGTSVFVGCDPACLGDCDGDPVLRLCDGSVTTCSGVDAIGANDRSECGSWCPFEIVTCPESGAVSALTGGWDARDAGGCDVALIEM
jgi:hypothetical protein